MTRILFWIFLIGHNFVYGQKNDVKTIKVLKDTSSIENGRRIYKLNCTKCHDDIKKASSLKGVTKKYPKIWLLNFIENSERLYYLKDMATIKIFKRIKDGGHIVYEGVLTKKDIDDLYNFLKKHKG